MQNPTMKTPLARCIHLGWFAGRALGKYPDNASLLALAAKMGAATSALDAASQAYEATKVTIVHARVDVRFADIFTDAEIKQMLRRATLADGAAGGARFKALAPNGQTPLVKPQGQAQVAVLVELENTLEGLADKWPEATQEKATVLGLRTSYEAAIAGREGAWSDARKARTARRMAKQAFVEAYLEVSFGVKALFPNEKKMHEIFFDEVASDVEKDLGEEEAPEGGEGTSGG